uniref:Putative conserved secreted protein n=1 Tax=Anopheles darlingi TaxID=43151 RepID=A0A2M4DIP6_ANODA
MLPLPTLLPLLLLLLAVLPALELLGGTSNCDEDEDEERKVRLWSLWLIPLSGDVVQLAEDAGASSFDRRVLSSSVEANATKRSNPELTRSCQLDSSSPTTSSFCAKEESFSTETIENTCR